MKGGHQVLKYYGGSHVKALKELYPGVEFDLQVAGRGSTWQSAQSRRNFFLQLAQEKAFDPQKEEPWYSVSLLDVKQKKVCDYCCLHDVFLLPVA
jgi:hypothetical protein